MKPFLIFLLLTLEEKLCILYFFYLTKFELHNMAGRLDKENSFSNGYFSLFSALIFLLLYFEIGMNGTS